MMVEEVSLPPKDVASLRTEDELQTILYYQLIPHYTILRQSNTASRPSKVWETVHKVNTALMSVYTPNILYITYHLKVVWKSKYYRLIGGHKQSLFNSISNLQAAGILHNVEKDDDEVELALRMERSDYDRGAFFNENRVNDCYTLNPELRKFCEFYLTDVIDDIDAAVKLKIDYATKKTRTVKAQLGKELPRCTNCGSMNPKKYVSTTGLCLDCMSAGRKP